MFDPLADAWLVTDSEGRKSVHLDYAKACDYAAHHGGTLEPLYRKRYEAFPRHLERRKP